MSYLQFSIRFCLWHGALKIQMEKKHRFDLLTSRKKLTRYGSCFSFAHTIQRNWISSFSVGVARTSPHSLINFCHIQQNAQLRQEESYSFIYKRWIERWQLKYLIGNTLKPILFLNWLKNRKIKDTISCSRVRKTCHTKT